MNQFKSADLTVLIGVPWRSQVWNPYAVNPNNTRNDVECYLNLHMPGWHHVTILDKPVRNLSMPQNYIGQHSVTVRVFYRSFELKRTRLLDQYPRPWWAHCLAS